MIVYLKQWVNKICFKPARQEFSHLESLLIQTRDCAVRGLAADIDEVQITCFRNTDSDGRCAVLSVYEYRCPRDGTFHGYTPVNTSILMGWIELVLEDKNWRHASFSLSLDKNNVTWR